MPSINMIAPKRADKTRMERDMRRLMLVILVELIVAVGLGGWVATRLFTTRNRISDLDVQIAKLQPIVKQIKQYDEATDKLVPKLKLLNEAKDGTMRWYNTLDRLAQSLPESTYLTRIGTSKTQNDDKQTSVDIGGISASQARVGEAILRFQAVPDFRSVDLRYTRKTDLPDFQAVSGKVLGTRSKTKSYGFEFEVGAVMKTNEISAGGSKNGNGQS